MNCPGTRTVNTDNQIQVDPRFYDDYEPIDLTTIYFPAIIAPPELVAAWDRIRAEYESLHGIIERKIGNPWYTIYTDCDGKEKLVDKIKRLIFSDTFPQMEAIPG